jgi:hypothetical protein
MFSEVIVHLRKAADATLQVQQEMFDTWTSLWRPVSPLAAGWREPVRKAQKQWAEVFGDLVQRQHELLQVQFGAGLQSVEDVFRLARAKDPEELRARAADFWQKTYERIRQVYEAQVRDFQAVAARGIGIITKRTTGAECMAPASEKAPRQPRPVAGLTEGELKEVRDGLYEYEMTKGDWSKAH